MSNRVSVIISARNEFPQICMTIDNIMLNMWESGIHDWEIIIADNASDDNTSRFWLYAWNVTYAKNSPHQLKNEYKHSVRGLANEGRVRFIYDPVYSNVGARHKAVKYARYENILFVDAHVSLKPKAIEYALETLNKHGGIVHGIVAWMGASIYNPHAGIQYTYKIGEKIFNTWNFAQVSDKPFYIPGSGHCFLMVKKKQYLDFGGYDTNQQIYGGGEPWLDTLWWLLGSTVMVDPRALVFHLSAGRGYSYNMNALIHNQMLTAYALGGHKWGERVLITYLEKEGTNKDFYKNLYAKAVKEGQSKRELVRTRQVRTIEELLCIDKENDCDGHCRGSKYINVSNHPMRIWDTMNEALYGKHLSFVVIFEEWLTRLQSPEAIEFYKNSPNQHS